MNLVDKKMNYSKELEEALKNYRKTGKEDIIIGKKTIEVILNQWSFSLNGLKSDLVKFFNKEGFECIDTGKSIGGNPVLKIFEDEFKLSIGYGAGAALIPCQRSILTKLD